MKKGFRIDGNDTGMYAMGATAVAGGVHFSFSSKGEACAVVLYKKGAQKPKDKIDFPVGSRIGDVWDMTVLGDFTGLEYVYEVNGTEVPDPYGRRISGLEPWGSLERLDRPVRVHVEDRQEPYNWEDDVLPRIPYESSVIYHLHVRGFTKHSSSGLEPSARGTFRGITQKIPYLRELGITTLEMMPPVEFEELVTPEHVEGSPFRAEKPDGKLNYWGYARGFYFSPKSSYASGPVREPRTEFKDMVKALHRAGMELVIELFFDGKETPSYVLDVVRFWAREYHVDGVRLVGYVPLKLLGEDPYLSRLKLFAPGWDGVKAGDVKHLAEYNEGFMLDMRSLLKGDEDQLNRLVYHNRHNPEQTGVINYMANTNGFTMMDMVSYDTKHNEANGENNRDGSDYNQSWNCGVEGPSRKKRVVQMRRKQVRNAMLLLFLSQGTPLIMMGDEFGRTKKGNNNSYCQDNDISWLNWGLLKSNSSLFEFVKQVIRFRKEHSVFHMDKEPALLDYRSVGLPDLSYHGLKTWCPAFDRFCRQLGMLYCGKYGKKPDGSEDDYFYVAYNMHWEPNGFALPNLPKDFKWHVAFNTDADEINGMYLPGTEPLLEDQKSMMIMARSVVVLLGKEVLPEAGEKRKGATRRRASGKNTAEKKTGRSRSVGKMPDFAGDETGAEAVEAGYEGAGSEEAKAAADGDVKVRMAGAGAAAVRNVQAGETETTVPDETVAPEENAVPAETASPDENAAPAETVSPAETAVPAKTAPPTSPAAKEEL